MATTDASDSRWFVDANVLVFAANPLSPWHTAAVARLQEARRDKISLVVNPQVVREFIAAASRPASGSPPPPIDPILEFRRSGTPRAKFYPELRLFPFFAHIST